MDVPYYREIMTNDIFLPKFRLITLNNIEGSSPCHSQAIANLKTLPPPGNIHAKCRKNTSVEKILMNLGVLLREKAPEKNTSISTPRVATFNMNETRNAINYLQYEYDTD